jgi:hypothetical protein
VPLVRSAATAACLTLFALPSAAQVRPMSAEAEGVSRVLAPRESIGESLIGWYGELQRIAAHLQWVHDRALHDPVLRETRDALVHAVKEAMDRADPELAGLAERAERLPAEHEVASRRGDAARAQALHREMARIQVRFMNVEARVMRDPAIVRLARSYEQLLRERMLTIEPFTEALLERSGQLQRLLQGAQSARPD